MKNLYKIILIVVVFILSILVLLLIVRPALTRSGGHIMRLTEEKERNKTLNSMLDSYVTARDEYYILNAENQKLNMELPEESDLSILTNEFYEIARYTIVEIQNISFIEILIDEKELKEIPVKEIEIDLVLQGDYYEILNYINTMEIMPRFIKIEDVMIQKANDLEQEDLLAFITAKTYFANEYYE
jgi:Tfp pilus assembly protein PilO